MNKYQKRVARGAAVLDQAQPGWDNDISLSLLDLSSNTNCVIAQAYEREFSTPKIRVEKSPFHFGFRRLRDAKAAPRTPALIWGFRRGFMPITDRQQTQAEAAWRELILARREERWARLDAERALRRDPDRNLALSA